MTTGGQQAQIGNVDLVKQLNGAAVYRLIDQQGPISRIQIADVSQLAPASVTKITDSYLSAAIKGEHRRPPGAVAQFNHHRSPPLSYHCCAPWVAMMRPSRS